MKLIIAKTREDYPDLPIMYNFLAVVYNARSNLTLSNADCAYMLHLQEKSLSVCKPDSFYRMQCLFNLGSTLNLLYTDDKDLSELNRAIDYLEQAVALLTPKTDHVRSGYLKTLSSALLHRFHRTENMADLERAQELKRMQDHH